MLVIKWVTTKTRRNTKVFFATDHADYTDFVSRRGIPPSLSLRRIKLDKACALPKRCARPLSRLPGDDITHCQGRSAG